MALQSSGQISLNEIHIEAGGTTGTQASINDSDIRGLISATSGSEMEFSDWYGASSALSTHSMTSGIDSTPYWYELGYTFSSPGGGASYGSMSPTSITWLISGVDIAMAQQNWGSGNGHTGDLPNKGIRLRLKRSNSAPTTSQSAFTSLTISGPSQTSQSGSFTTRSETLATSSASFSYNVNGFSEWRWLSPTYWWFGSTTSNAYTLTFA